MQLMIAGPPGAGKGTQSALICEHFRLSHLSTGEVLREAVRTGTEVGRQAEAIMRAGDLLPDAVMLRLVTDWIGALGSRRFLLDGFPRTKEQAEGLEANAVRLDAVIHLDLPDDIIVSRLAGRRVHMTSGRIYHQTHNPPRQPDRDDQTGEILVRREDDDPKAIRRRLENYRQQTEPVLRYYRERGDIAYLPIGGSGEVNEVFERICAGLRGPQGVVRSATDGDNSTG